MESGKESKSKQLIELAVGELTIAKYMCELHPSARNEFVLLEINKCLAKLYCKLKKSEEAIKLLEACSKMKKDFYTVSNLHKFYFNDSTLIFNFAAIALFINILLMLFLS